MYVVFEKIFAYLSIILVVSIMGSHNYQILSLICKTLKIFKKEKFYFYFTFRLVFQIYISDFSNKSIYFILTYFDMIIQYYQTE